MDTAQPDEADPGRYAAVDVHYPAGGGARAALVVAAEPTFAAIIDERTAVLETVAPYQPGVFYARELPAIRAVLANAGRVDLLIIDGYVHLDAHGRPGLGAHAYQEFAVPVIGVAKSAFRSASHAIPVRRGNAQHPLYVTAIGIPAEQAATIVARMAGPYRLPDALRRVDALSRGRVPPAGRVGGRQR